MTEPVGAGRFMKSPAPSMARSRPSTSARSAGSAAQASLKKADRSAGDSISRAWPKIDFTSGLVAFIVWSSRADSERVYAKPVGWVERRKAA